VTGWEFVDGWSCGLTVDCGMYGGGTNVADCRLVLGGLRVVGLLKGWRVCCFLLFFMLKKYPSPARATAKGTAIKIQ